MPVNAPRKTSIAAPFAILALTISLSACSTVGNSSDSSVVRTDMGASMQKLWTNIFTGKASSAHNLGANGFNGHLRGAPQADYHFGTAGSAHSAPTQYSHAPAYGAPSYKAPSYNGAYDYDNGDAALNTHRLQNYMHRSAAAQPVYAPQTRPSYAAQGYHQSKGHHQSMTMPQHAETRIQPQYKAPVAAPVQTQTALPNVTVPNYGPNEVYEDVSVAPKKRSLGKRISSLFKSSKKKHAPEISDPTLAGEPLAGYETLPVQTQRQTPPPRSQPVYNSNSNPNYGPDVYYQNQPAYEGEHRQASAPAPQAVYTPNTQTAQQNGNARRVADIDSDGLSYVKMGGGSDIKEWEACEKASGGYFIAGPAGYSVKPAFDSCMRGKGYKSEAEAIEALSIKG